MRASPRQFIAERLNESELRDENHPPIRSGVAHRGRTVADSAPFRSERVRWDPKDGELCSKRVKPEETLVEARRGSDVQIDRRI